ncbi:MAG: prepilin-type N-terminal cleavage/methylation domain-containing protein [Gemmatimonadota bacterium]|nr:prepilin-type N-terminal cleavage/methylation domain-containing protein [Gemmatimonadota bacterium]
MKTSNHAGKVGGRAGFTMVEVIVAIVILAIGLLGLAGSSGYLIRTVSLGDLMTERSAAFQSTIDRLQSLPYDSVTTGTDSVGVFAVSWDAVDDGPQSKILTIVTVGPGLEPGASIQQSPTVADTFVFRILRD